MKAPPSPALPKKNGDKSHRGNASQFFIAGELCRRGYSAVVTLGNTPHVDILCSNKEGTAFAHIQVKTFVPGNKTCSVGVKAMKNAGTTFFWVLGGIPLVGSPKAFEYYIIPAKDMAENVAAAHELWLKTPGKSGQSHQDNTVRTVHLPPWKSFSGWSIESYRDRWDLIEAILAPPSPVTVNGAHVTIPPTALAAIEKQFHELIEKRASEFGVEISTLALPVLCEATPRNELNRAWLEVAEMHGGFAYWLVSDGDSPKLIAESWSRVVEGSGQRHEIDTNGSKLVTEAFV